MNPEIREAAPSGRAHLVTPTKPRPDVAKKPMVRTPASSAEARPVCLRIQQVSAAIHLALCDFIGSVESTSLWTCSHLELCVPKT